MDAETSTNITVDRISNASCEHCGVVNDVSTATPFSEATCAACGKTFTVPAKFGSFLLLRVLGSGGMGCVYHGRDESLGRDVAIKVLLKSVGENTVFIEHFRREAQAAAKLNHPNIAQIYSFGQEYDQPYIVMELVAGQRFDKMVETQAPMDQALVIQVALDIAEGLQAAMEIGLVHGDIKPENILLDEKMHAKLVDFGIATLGEETGGIWGTPYYISPEKVLQRPCDFRSDLYSLGATLYHALSGRPPFEGETPIDVVKARLNRNPRDLRAVRTDIDKLLARVVGRMLQQDPALRHPTIVSLTSDLRECLKTLTPADKGAKQTGTRKTIMVRKKAATGAPGTSTEKPAPATTETRKESQPAIVAPKKTIKTLRVTPPAAAQAPAAEAPADAPVEAAALQQEELERQERERRKKRRARLKITIIVTTLLLLGLGVTGGVILADHYTKQKAIEQAARAEYLALQKLRKEADQYVGEIRKIQRSVQQTASFAPRFLNVVTTGLAVVEGITLANLTEGADTNKFAEGSPSQAYQRYQAAMKKGDAEAVFGLTSRIFDTQAPAKEEIQKMLPDLQKIMPAAFSVSDEQIEDDKALLTTKGRQIQLDTKTEKEVNGKVSMVKENGAWKVKQEKWGPTPAWGKWNAGKKVAANANAPKVSNGGPPAELGLGSREELDRQHAEELERAKSMERAQKETVEAANLAAKSAGNGPPAGLGLEPAKGAGGAADKKDTAEKKEPAEKKEADAAAAEPKGVPGETEYSAKALDAMDIRGLGRVVIEATNILSRLSSTSQASVDSSTNLYAQMLAVTNSAAAAPVLEEIKNVRQPLDSSPVLAAIAVKNIEQASIRVEQIRVTTVRKREEKRMAEQEQKRVQDYAKLVQDELAKIPETPKAVKPYITDWKFKDAVQQAQQDQKQFTTPEAKAEAQRYVDRYEYLAKFKDHLIRWMNKDPFKWGWLRPDGRQEDILKATDMGIEIKDRKVDWNKLPPAQLSRILRRYMTRPELSRTEQGAVYAGLAILLDELQQAEESGKVKEKAVATDPYLESEIPRLFP